VEHLYQAALGLVGHYGYGGLFAAMAFANIGAPLGSELILPVSGGLSATGHLGSVWLTILVSVLAELAGGTVGYLIGRFGGRPLIDRYGRYVHLSHENLDRVHAFFERYGSFSIFICRFIPMIRGIVSIPAGLAEMNLAQFYGWYAAGSAIFCGGLILLGAELGDHLDAVLPLLHRVGLLTLVAALAILIVLVFVVRARRNELRKSTP
jgi:membrane protein DedA with SNARE-associated domain